MPIWMLPIIFFASYGVGCIVGEIMNYFSRRKKNS